MKTTKHEQSDLPNNHDAEEETMWLLNESEFNLSTSSII